MKIIFYLFAFLISVKSFATKITTGTPGTNLSITSTTIASLSNGDTLQINTGTYTGYSQVGTHKAIYILPQMPGVTINFGGTTNTAIIQNCSQFKLIGLYFYNGTYRGLELNGNVDSCLIQCSFRSFRDYVIWNTGLTYTGTAATRNNALDLRITADSIYQGPVLHLTNMIYDSYIQNCRVDSLLGFTQNCFEWIGRNITAQYDTFTNINNLPGGGHGHCGIMVPFGEFTIHDCIRETFEGEDRLRPYTIDSAAGHTRGTSYYYNMWAHNSQKYGMAEIQTFGTDTTTNTNLPNVRSGDVNIFNNTAMTFRDSVVDIIYTQAGSMFALEQCTNTHGKIWNNVIIRPRADANQGTLTNQTNTIFYNIGGSLSQFDTSHNQFYLTFAPSGLLDSITGRIGLTSPLVNAGVAFPTGGFNLDAIGTSRPQGIAWDIGRYEFVFGIYNWIRKRKTILK